MQEGMLKGRDSQMTRFAYIWPRLGKIALPALSMKPDITVPNRYHPDSYPFRNFSLQLLFVALFKHFY